MSKLLKNSKLIILFIFIFAFVLRFWNIEKIPPSLNWDEISHGYNAYSILKTAKDEWGEFMPLIFRAYGDYKLPVYIYFTAPSIAVFGLNELGVRFVSIIFGSLAVLFTYFLSKEIFKDKKNKEFIAILATFFVAIEPWTFFISRGAFEANLAFSFVVLGILLFFKSFQNALFLPFSFFFLSLSTWTYNSARVFVPAILVFMFLIYRKNLIYISKTEKSKFFISVAILVFMIIPMFVQLITPVGQARYSKVSIIDEGAINEINELRRVSEYPDFIDRILYNKGTYFVWHFAQNLLSHFEVSYLFTNGGSHYQFSVPGYGLLNKANIVFFYLGLVFVIFSKLKNKYLIIFWLISGTFASSLTRESPHVLRSVTMLPVPMIITSYGLVSSYFFLKEKLILFKKYKVVFVVFYILTFWTFAEEYLRNYFSQYALRYSQAWQYGYKQALDYVKRNYSNYDRIVFTKKYGEPHMFVLFYLKWDPAKYIQDQNLNRFFQSNWWWVDGFDKFVFVNDWQINDKIESNIFVTESKKEIDCSLVKCLLFSSHEIGAVNWNKIDQIKFLDGSVAFEIYEN
ncbi:MAG: glycosyltransferase family 39 protein [Patescibacteria group bacterium]|nr:glycosyltransferase family 39 protein [Patescibacteria group bacterium]